MITRDEFGNFIGTSGPWAGQVIPTDLVSMIQTALKESGDVDYGMTSGKFDEAVAKVDPMSFFQNRDVSAVNPILQSMGLTPYASSTEAASRNTALPGHNAQNFSGIFGAPLDLGVAGIIGGAGAGAAGLYGAPATSAAAGGTAGGAALMPAAVPESAATLANWGLVETAPGVFSAAAPAGAGALGGATAAPVAAPSAPTAGAAATGLGGVGNLLSNPTALGIGGGALLGGLGGSQQAGTITVEEGIPDWLQPYVKPALDKYSTDLQNYQIDPFGVMPSAMKEFQNTVSGMYLDPSTNKYLDDYFRLGAERVKGSLSPSFGHMNAFGQHSGYNEALSRGLGDFATGLYGGAYNKERDRQTQLTAAAPSFIGQSSTAAFAPYQQYLNSVGSLGKKKDQPYFENPFGNILGGALLGGSLGSIWK